MMEQRDRIILAQNLNDSWQDLRDLISHYGPSSSHDGSCGPWSPCDGICVEMANVGSIMSRHQSLLYKLSKELIDLND